MSVCVRGIETRQKTTKCACVCVCEGKEYGKRRDGEGEEKKKVNDSGTRESDRWALQSIYK